MSGDEESLRSDQKLICQ